MPYFDGIFRPIRKSPDKIETDLNSESEKKLWLPTELGVKASNSPGKKKKKKKMNVYKALLEAIAIVPLLLLAAIIIETLTGIPKEITLLICTLFWAVWGKSYTYWNEKEEKRKK